MLDMQPSFQVASMPIPVDVWCHIFNQCLPSFDERKSFQQVLVPWTLSQVCREWRHVVHSLASLWSNILVHRLYPAGGDGVDLVQRDVEMLKLQLHYSKEYPLDIIYNPSGWPSSPIISPNPLWVELIPHLSRSRILFVKEYCSDKVYISARTSLPESTLFPSLEYLYWDRFDAESAIRGSFDLFRNAPRLQSLSLRGDFGTNIDHIPWDKATEVRLRQINVARIIPRLSNAQTLHIGDPYWGGGTQELQRHTLPKLRSFIMPTCDLSRIVGVQYSFPNLQALELLHSGPYVPVIGPLSTMLRNTGAANITTLRISQTDEGVGAPLLEQLLRYLPLLTFLSLPLDKLETAYALIDLLCPTSPGLPAEPLCPALQTFTSYVDIKRKDLVPLNISPWMEMVRHRALQKLEIASGYAANGYWRVDDPVEGFDIVFSPAFNHRNTRRVLTSLKRQCSLDAFFDVAKNGDLWGLSITSTAP